GYDPTTHQVSWRTGWANLLKKAGLPHFRFHDLRHHCITRLAEAGVADQTLMAIAGHVSKAMLDHYSHVRLQARRDAVAALDPPKKSRHYRSDADGESQLMASTQMSTPNGINTRYHPISQRVPECTRSTETLADRALQASKGYVVIVPSESCQGTPFS